MNNGRAVIVIDGEKETRFESVKEASRLLQIHPDGLRKRLMGKIKGETRIFKYANDKVKKNNGKLVSRKKLAKENEVFQNVPYETIGTRVCITPCRHKQDFKIGSVRCQTCSSHRGMNREERYVVCSCKDYEKRFD